MKNSDMKVIAIILSIALFFTIITSNAVSIASVVMLAKDGGSAATQEGTATPGQGTATTPGASTGTATTPDAGTATTPDAGTATTPDAGTATKPADKPADNGGAASPVDEKALAFYQKAAQNQHKTGAQGYTKIAYQNVIEVNVGNAGGTLQKLIDHFMTTEEDARANAKVRAKGSEEAKDKFPESTFTKSCVKSCKMEDKGADKLVTIVFNQQDRLEKSDKDGLHVATRWDLLYIEDVENTVKNDGFVKALVKSLDRSSLVYKNFTIKALMTKDGKFKSVDMDGEGCIDASAKLLVGKLEGTGTLGFHVRYYDFTK